MHGIERIKFTLWIWDIKTTSELKDNRHSYALMCPYQVLFSVAVWVLFRLIKSVTTFSKNSLEKPRVVIFFPGYIWPNRFSFCVLPDQSPDMPNKRMVVQRVNIHQYVLLLPHQCVCYTLRRLNRLENHKPWSRYRIQSGYSTLKLQMTKTDSLRKSALKPAIPCDKMVNSCSKSGATEKVNGYKYRNTDTSLSFHLVLCKW